MKKKTRFAFGGVVALLASAGLIAVVASGNGNAASGGDHLVDNLGEGTTASDFDGNSSSDCSSETFQAAGYDLWHFVVNQASDPTTMLSWNEENSVWSNPSEVDVVDVTTQYGNYTSGDGTKHLWIATTPPGATLVTAYLNYDGTAGRENLSHSCGRSEPTPSIKIDPTIRYDMAWDWQVDKTVDWSVKPTGGYTLAYDVQASRSANAHIVAGTLHVTDGVLVVPPTLELTDLTVTFTQGAYSQPCAVTMSTLKYDCTLDSSKVTTSAATGRPIGSGTLSAVATYSGGTLTDSLDISFDGVEPTTTYGETASLVDDYATPSNVSDDQSSSTTELTYTFDWSPSGSTCNERTNTATAVIDNPEPGTENPTDSVTVRWCPPMPGRTIGYWGNKTGAEAVFASITSLKTKYPNALFGFAPANASAVRTYFQNANCNGDCKTMFTAQFLATAMNARDTDFAAQGVEFGGECISVADLLTEANAVALGASKTWYVAYKSIFDDINNSRQITCLAVID